MSTQAASWRDGVDIWPRALPRFEIDARSTALMLVDMQNFDTQRDCALGVAIQKRFPKMYEYYYPRVEQLVIPNAVRLLHFFRQHGLRVVHITMGPELPDGADFYTPRREADRQLQLSSGIKTMYHKGSREHAIIEPLTPLPNELVVNKTSVGAFNSTGIDQLLRKLRVDSLVICGVTTNACVETTARDAADRWYKCVLVEDACAAFEHRAHEETMRNFARLFGMVLSTDEVVTLLSRQLAGHVRAS